MKFLKIFIMMLTFLVIHCTATPENREVSKADIHQWHIVNHGWHQVGYSDIIHLDGKVENLVSYNADNIVDPWEITNGVAGINCKSRHIVYSGGMDKQMKNAKDTRTNAQKFAMMQYVLNTIKEHPNIVIAGHNQFDNKACPSFDVPEWLKSVNVPDKNIYKGKYKPKPEPTTANG